MANTTNAAADAADAAVLADLGKTNGGPTAQIADDEPKEEKRRPAMTGAGVVVR